MNAALLFQAVFLSVLSQITEGQIMMSPTSDLITTVNLTKILLEKDSDSNTVLNLTHLLLRSGSDTNSTRNLTDLLLGSGIGTSFNKTIIIKETFGQDPDSDTSSTRNLTDLLLGSGIGTSFNKTIIIKERFGQDPDSDTNSTRNLTDLLQGSGIGTSFNKTIIIKEKFGQDPVSDFNKTERVTDHFETKPGTSDLPTTGSDQNLSDSNRTIITTDDLHTGSELPTGFNRTIIIKERFGQDPDSDFNKTERVTDNFETKPGTSDLPSTGSDQKLSDSNRTIITTDDLHTGSELPTGFNRTIIIKERFGQDPDSDFNKTERVTDHFETKPGTSDLPSTGSDQKLSDSNRTIITTDDLHTGSELPTGTNNTERLKEEFRTAIDARTGLKLPTAEKTDHVPSVKLPRLPFDQGELIALCAKKCKTELCYLADETDCRNYITCQRDSQGGLMPENYHAIRQPCAFGTYWAGLQKQKKITCDLPQNVLCNIDYCAGKPLGARYNHMDGNCKTYWQCDGLGNPIPKCCPEGYRYSDRVDMCVEDTIGTCHDRCPIKIDACLVPGTKTEFFDDGNCRTYWNCEDQHPHPVCCPEGQGYDVVDGCVENPNCTDYCPKQYDRDICVQPGVEKYSLIDGSCRTYMKCNPVSGDERWCCPPNFVFVGENQTCIERTPDMNLLCNDECPPHFKEECQLRSVPGEIDTFYMQTSIGPIKLPCAPGTFFDAKICGCGTINKKITNNACNKELDIIFDAPMWHRHGSERQVDFKPVWHKRLPNGEFVISEVGTVEEGPKLENMASAKFTGELFFRAPFFQSQYEKLYIRVVFMADMEPTTMKRILLSNCMDIDLGAAPMELSLQGDRVVLELTTDNIIRRNASVVQNAPVIASVPFTPGIWNSFTAIYDGREVLLINEGQGKPMFDRQPLSGPVSVAAEGLDVGGCLTSGPKDGFIGYISQLEFSKCVRREWIEEFNTKLAVP